MYIPNVMIASISRWEINVGTKDDGDVPKKSGLKAIMEITVLQQQISCILHEGDKLHPENVLMRGINNSPYAVLIHVFYASQGL